VNLHIIEISFKEKKFITQISKYVCSSRSSFTHCLTLAASTPGASPRTAGLQLDASNLCSTSDDTPEGKEYFADSDIMLSLDCDILYMLFLCSLQYCYVDVGCGMWDVGCGMWDVGCGMWDVGCGMWDVG
jgi:hypothetical protein